MPLGSGGCHSRRCDAPLLIFYYADTFQYDLPSSSSPKTAPKTVYLDPIALNPTLDDRLWTYKTTERGAYQEAMQRASEFLLVRRQYPLFIVSKHFRPRRSRTWPRTPVRRPPSLACWRH